MGSIRRERFTVDWREYPLKADGTVDYQAAPVTISHQVEVEVDLAGLAAKLGRKACRASGGRAVEAGGLVKVRKVKD